MKSSAWRFCDESMDRGIRQRIVNPWGRALLLLLLCLGMLGESSATTWRVERDGSGDFSTIPPAAMAASQGDTILLGPGHYTEYVTATVGGNVLNYYVWLEDDDILLRGVGRDEVKIGPDLASGYDPGAVGFVQAGSSGSIHVEGITFAHCISGIVTSEASVVIRDCRFEWTEAGINSNATGSVLVERCEFTENERGILQFDSASTPELVVRDCQFWDIGGQGIGIDSQEENNLIEDCQFRSLRGGVQFSARGIGVIRNCTFEDNYIGIRLASWSIADLRDNQISGGAANMQITNDSHATGTGNVLSGSEIVAIDFGGQATASMEGNHILIGAGTERIWVRSKSDPIHMIDLRNNYWGTTSTQDIADSILDSVDNPDVTGTVLFEPFAGMPVSTERTSFGGLKARFGPEQ